VIVYQQRWGKLTAGGENQMNRISNLVLKLKVWKDTRGQDLIEYALMAGFVAVAAGAIMPGVASSISVIFSKISSVMSAASTQS
jgi:pilus assembly protein Flp/PilA